jgi:hypothetical protein
MSLLDQDPSGRRLAQQLRLALLQPFNIQSHIRFYALELNASPFGDVVVDDVGGVGLLAQPVMTLCCDVE